MAKIKLELEPDPEVTVIGISSHVNDYRLCWSLNLNMGLTFSRRRADISENADGRVTRYSVFDHMTDEGPGGFTLVNNHGSNGILIKEQRQADYFLVVDNELAANIPDLMEKVRGSEFVLTAFPLELEALRSGHKLLL